MVFKVLSLDGGGIRGIYTATILTKLESDLNEINAKIEENGEIRKTSENNKLSDYFDLIVGTSTGGIITALLLTPDSTGKAKFSAADILNLYKTRGDEIFHRSVVQTITSVGGLIDEKYSSESITKLLHEYGENIMLSDLIKPCVITSYDTVARAPLLFKQHKTVDGDREFSMVDVCLATSAAPTYFEPALIKSTSGKEYSVIDGAMVENNPVMCGYIEAMKLRRDQEPIVMVSIGTGINCKQFPHDQIKDYGLIQWISPIIDILLDGRTQTPDYIVRKIYETNNDLENYFRFNSTLPTKLTSMDNFSEKNLQGLIKYANKKIEQLVDSGEWQALLSRCGDGTPQTPGSRVASLPQ